MYNIISTQGWLFTLLVEFETDAVVTVPHWYKGLRLFRDFARNKWPLRGSCNK